MAAEHDEILTKAAAAERLGIHPDTLKRWERLGLLRPSFRTAGGHRRYRLSEVQAFLDQAAPLEKGA